MESHDANIRTFALTLGLLIVQLLSCTRTTPHRVAIQNIMQGHPVAQLVRQVSPPAPAEPIVVRLDAPTPAEKSDAAFFQANADVNAIRQGDLDTQIVFLAPAP